MQLYFFLSHWSRWLRLVRFSTLFYLYHTNLHLYAHLYMHTYITGGQLEALEPQWSNFIGSSQLYIVYIWCNNLYLGSFGSVGWACADQSDGHGFELRLKRIWQKVSSKLCIELVTPVCVRSYSNIGGPAYFKSTKAHSRFTSASIAKSIKNSGGHPQKPSVGILLLWEVGGRQGIQPKKPSQIKKADFCSGNPK